MITEIYLSALIILSVANILETRFPLYILQKPLVVRITLLAPLLYIIGVGLSALSTVIEGVSATVILLVLTYPIIRYLIFYGRAGDRFVGLDHAMTHYKGFLDDEPEMVVVYTSSHHQDRTAGGLPHHIIPTKILMVNDLVLSVSAEEDIIYRYSLTFCTLCNTIHGYALPEIDGREVELTSNRGMVINGNKILTDRSGRYIWQQFNGHPISDDNLPHLKELRVSRMTWKQVRHRFPDARYYHEGVKMLTYLVFSVVRRAVRSLSFVGLSRGGRDRRLPKKELVVGVHLDMETRAYPLTIFTKEVMLLEDSLAGTSFTLVHTGHGTQGFSEIGLRLHDGHLQREDRLWHLDGSAVGDHNNLEVMPITDQMYWYLWCQFYPQTTVYGLDPDNS